MAKSLKSRSVDRPYRIIFIVCALITVGAGVIWKPDVDEELKEGPSRAGDWAGVYDLGYVPGVPSGSIRRLAQFLPSDHDPGGDAVHGTGNLR